MWVVCRCGWIVWYGIWCGLGRRALYSVGVVLAENWKTWAILCEQVCGIRPRVGELNELCDIHHRWGFGS